MIRYFAELVRFSHTIFAMPFAIASLFLSSNGFPSLFLFLKIILSVLFCRNSAMAFNRLVDASIDARNKRTQNRHLPKGLLTPFQVILFTLVNMIFFILISYQFNFLCFILSFPVLFVVCSYSYFKRFSSLSQFFLGFSIGISPIATSIAVTGHISIESILLGLALLFWVTGFDTIYATADHEFDQKHHLYSLVTWLGIKKAFLLAKICHFLTFSVLILLGSIYLNTLPYWICIVFIFIILVYIHFFNSNHSLDGLNQKFFLANALISLLLLIGVIISTVFL